VAWRVIVRIDQDTRANPKLIEIADKVRRLSPSHRNPERFHEDKSEIERDLRRLARRVGNG
jgi:hypothetical protein